MIILISLLILVHEIGHYVAAGLCGVRVTRFGFGMPFGPSLKLFKWGHTNFYIHAFLFGGYVSFADSEEEIEDKKEKEELEEDEILPKDSKELYENKTILQKLFIVTAGVLMNVLFAVFLTMFAAIYYHKLPLPKQNIYIGDFSPQITSNIQERGILKGDRIYKINNQTIDTFYALNFYARNSRWSDNYAQEDLIRENLAQLQKLNPQIKDTIEEGTIIRLGEIKPEKPLDVRKQVLQGLEKYKPQGIKLSETQIKYKDEVLKNKNTYLYKQIKGQEGPLKLTLLDIATILSDSYKPVDMVVIRDNKEIEIKDIIIQKEGIFGIMLKLEDLYAETKTPKQIIKGSISYLYTTTNTMLYSLWQLISGKVDASDMHGVIAIVKIGGDVIAYKGMLNGILLTAMISINLAIMNILPIPALDGGHVAFLIIEKITGRKPTKELSDKITNFFFALLLILMVAICYNDIFALVTKKF